jgi:hypothetical protein
MPTIAAHARLARGEVNRGIGRRRATPGEFAAAGKSRTSAAHPENKEGIMTILQLLRRQHEFIKTRSYLPPVDQTTAPDGMRVTA